MTSSLLRHNDRCSGVEADDVFSLGDDRLLRMELPAGERLDPRVERAYRTATRDETTARHALYGERSGSVGRATPRHLRHVVQHCTDIFNNDQVPTTEGERR